MQKGKLPDEKRTGMGSGHPGYPALFFTAFGKMKDTADMSQQEEFTSMEYKELPAVQSELSDPEGCYLCGTAKESMMGYFRQFDDLGIISVNQWYGRISASCLMRRRSRYQWHQDCHDRHRGRRRFLFQHTDTLPWDFQGESQLWGR